MSRLLISPVAQAQLDEIYAYSVDRWGQDQAERYTYALIETFGRIAADTAPSRPILAVVGVDGYVCRCGSHNIYWWRTTGGAVAVVAILHHRMDQTTRMRSLDDR